MVFLVAGVIDILGCLIYLMFSSGKEQDFNRRGLSDESRGDLKT